MYFLTFDKTKEPNFWELFIFDSGGREPMKSALSFISERVGAIMFAWMFWVNFAGGTAFVLFGATTVVLIGVL